MPGIEVFTISGVDPTTGVYHADSPAVAAASPAVRLQNALKALGTTAGDAQLMGITVDGFVGANTVKLTNYALAHFVGATPGFPTANLTLAQVKASAAVLADRVTARVKASGGIVPPPPVIAKRPTRAATPFSPKLTPPEADHRWVFWVVGGVGVLVLLSAATIAIKKRREVAHA